VTLRARAGSASGAGTIWVLLDSIAWWLQSVGRQITEATSRCRRRHQGTDIDSALALLARCRPREVPEVIVALAWIATYEHLVGDRRRRDAAVNVAAHLLGEGARVSSYGSVALA
jgi:hypothetical protein